MQLETVITTHQAETVKLFKNSPRKMKVFCIGQNKTGTTSLEAALSNIGYKIGNQIKGEKLLNEWANRYFKNIINLCSTADAFQDIPFSNLYTYIVLDYAFPGSKFILTIRDNKDQWYESLTRFHTKIIGKNRLPTMKDLQEHNYRYKGYLWDSQKFKYGIDESTLYDYDIYTSHYESHNRQVMDYFRYRENDLLVLNVAKQDAINRLYKFLGHPYSGEIMPHRNSSR